MFTDAYDSYVPSDEEDSEQTLFRHRILKQTISSYSTGLILKLILLNVNNNYLLLLLFSRIRSREIQIIADVESIALLVAKNMLVGKAIEGTQWEALKPCMSPRGARAFESSSIQCSL
ncbi:uncharacterized protein LOC109835249 [Asparagus officinalis]|uniref:uncharacterized protein LOC109835249 n=1 Tax=Asparagus officinalis TaxID=4686 RepID=UPI00098E0772|nr:uncharacterized protein LOC109835249 [Asparagus officinalis]